MFRFIFLLSLFLLLKDALAQQELRLAYGDIEAAPYQLGEGAKVASPPGIALEIIQQAADNIGVKIEFLRYPNRRLLHHLQHGVVDGIFIFSHLKEREVYGVYPMKSGRVDNDKRIASLKYFLYRRKNTAANWDGERFSPLDMIVGAMADVSIISLLKQHELAVAEVNTVEQLYLLLKKGRVDAVASQDIKLAPYFAAHQIKDVELVQPPLANKDYYLMLSHQFYRRHPRLAEKLWQEIALVRKAINHPATN